MTAIESLRARPGGIELQGEEMDEELAFGFVERLDADPLIQALAGKDGVHFGGVPGLGIRWNLDFQAGVELLPDRGAGIGDGLGNLVVADHVRVKAHLRKPVRGVDADFPHTRQFLDCSVDGVLVLLAGET